MLHALLQERHICINLRLCIFQHVEFQCPIHLVLHSFGVMLISIYTVVPKLLLKSSLQNFVCHRQFLYIILYHNVQYLLGNFILRYVTSVYIAYITVCCIYYVTFVYMFNSAKCVTVPV